MDDPRRIDQLVALGYGRSDIEDSLRLSKFDDIYATYLLMGRRVADVSGLCVGEGVAAEVRGSKVLVGRWVGTNW